jgi:hypothetical protein
VPLAPAPVDPEVLRQEGAHDEPGAVVHPALAQELAHARIDEGKAGLARAPALEAPPRVAPPQPAAAVALLELRPRVAREVRQDLVEEVAPAELATKGVRAGAAAEALVELARGDAAEVQVGRQPRGALARQGVVRVAVAAHAVGEEAPHPLAARPLAAGQRLRDLLLQSERGQRRQPSLAHPGRQRRQPARRAQHRPALGAKPGAVKRREHRVRPAGLGAWRLVDDAEPGVQHEIGHPRVASRRERTGVGSGVDSRGADLAGQPREFALGSPVPDDEAAAALAQRMIQIAQALEQELRPRPGRVAAAQETIVEAEHRDHATVLERRVQGGVIGDAQIPAVPEQGGHPIRAPMESTARSRVLDGMDLDYALPNAWEQAHRRLELLPRATTRAVAAPPRSASARAGAAWTPVPARGRSRAGWRHGSARTATRSPPTWM